MGRIVSKTGKQARPKTAVKSKRFRCAKCRKRSPKPVRAPAPWYCPICLRQKHKASDAEAVMLGGPRCRS
jgi:late competence protein required for DNA uptake (superfamily II DNA/RNA helicase)